MKEKAVVTIDQAGCWSDSTRGRYQGEHIQAIAFFHGWKGEELTAYHMDYDKAVEAAEKYMNTLVGEGYSFYSNENGDWGLWASNPSDDDWTILADDSDN